MLELIHGNYPSSGFNEDQIKAQSELVATLRANQSWYGARFVTRIEDLAKSNDRRANPKAVLKEWKKRGVLNISAKEIAAWEKVRHKVAHGKLLFNSPNIEEWESVFYDVQRVVNAINKIFLQLIGYQGPYWDFSEMRPMVFTPSPANLFNVHTLL